MKSIYVFLDNHTDLELNKLLSGNIKWIKQNFSVLLMESVPRHLEDKQALDYLFNKVSPGVDCHDCVLRGAISSDEGDFLRRPYSEDMSPQAFIKKRIEIYTKILPLAVDQSTWTCWLNSLARCEFYFDCLNEDIKLRGMEPLDYQPALFNSQKRDASMFQTICYSAASSSTSKPVLAITGASHGIGLIANLCRIGQFSCHFIRLATSTENISPSSPFEQFRLQILSKWSLGYAQEVRQEIISTSLPPEEQQTRLQDLISSYSGCALPPNMEQNIELGGSRFK